ncbi:hypothetical protein [Streptomyces decoyicus]|uniref:hypothetical protein n=1 Tax=Streptomyces decoyicus TaxID=249567 RepID=UPI00364B7471
MPRAASTSAGSVALGPATVRLISSPWSPTFALGRPAVFGTSPLFSVTVMCGKRPVAWMA